MPDDQQLKNTWPLVKFMFRVTIGDMELMFQEVTGLSSELKQVEYRHGNSLAFSPIKMPGIQKFGNVTLKKGVVKKSDRGAFDQYADIKRNSLKRQTITISLLDESQSPVMSWSLTDAFSSKITVTDMKADANEVAIETMEIVHKGLNIVG